MLTRCGKTSSVPCGPLGYAFFCGLRIEFPQNEDAKVDKKNQFQLWRRPRLVCIQKHNFLQMEKINKTSRFSNIMRRRRRRQVRGSNRNSFQKDFVCSVYSQHRGWKAEKGAKVDSQGDSKVYNGHKRIPSIATNMQSAICLFLMGGFWSFFFSPCVVAFLQQL